MTVMPRSGRPAVCLVFCCSIVCRLLVCLPARSGGWPTCARLAMYAGCLRLVCWLSYSDRRDDRSPCRSASSRSRSTVWPSSEAMSTWTDCLHRAWSGAPCPRYFGSPCDAGSRSAGCYAHCSEANSLDAVAGCSRPCCSKIDGSPDLMVGWCARSGCWSPPEIDCWAGASSCSPWASGWNWLPYKRRKPPACRFGLWTAAVTEFGSICRWCSAMPSASPSHLSGCPFARKKAHHDPD